MSVVAAVKVSRLAVKSMISVALVTTLLAAPALSKDLTADEVRALQTSLKSADTLSADFVQTTFKSTRGKSTVRKGHAVFARPDKFKWILKTPVEEQKIYDGQFFYDYSAESKAAKRFSPTGPQAHALKSIVDLVLNFDTLLKRYEMVKAEENGNEVRIELTPKANGEIKSVELKLVKGEQGKEAFITFLKMDLKNGNSQTHEFSNPSRAALGPDAFKLPAGVKVTDSN